MKRLPELARRPGERADRWKARIKKKKLDTESDLRVNDPETPPEYKAMGIPKTIELCYYCLSLRVMPGVRCFKCGRHATGRLMYRRNKNV